MRAHIDSVCYDSSKYRVRRNRHMPIYCGLKLILANVQQFGMILQCTPNNPGIPFTVIREEGYPRESLNESPAFLTDIGLTGRLTHTPGHSDDSVSLVLANGGAFTGDLPLPDRVDPSIKTVATASWQALRAAAAARIFPGHEPGRPNSEIVTP